MKKSMMGRCLASRMEARVDNSDGRLILRTMAAVWFACAAATLWVLVAACAPHEERPVAGGPHMKQAFKRDRANCQRVVEQTTPYVDPKNSRAVGERSYRVEGEVQKCMLARGWNDPRFDGWKAGRY